MTLALFPLILYTKPISDIKLAIYTCVMYDNYRLSSEVYWSSNVPPLRIKMLLFGNNRVLN